MNSVFGSFESVNIPWIGWNLIYYSRTKVIERIKDQKRKKKKKEKRRITPQSISWYRSGITRVAAHLRFTTRRFSHDNKTRERMHHRICNVWPAMRLPMKRVYFVEGLTEEARTGNSRSVGENEREIKGGIASRCVKCNANSIYRCYDRTIFTKLYDSTVKITRTIREKRL